MISHQDIMVEFKLIPPFIPIYDLKILLIVNLVPKDILTIISSGENVKYMILWCYPGYSWHVSMLSTPISCVKKIEPSPFFLRKAAIKYKIPYITTLAAAIAAAKGIAAYRKGKGSVRSLQSYHRDIT